LSDATFLAFVDSDCQPVGNWIDRASYGYVTDFILWKVGAHRWPNFNVADAALLIGIAGLLIDMKPPEKENKSTKAKARA